MSLFSKKAYVGLDIGHHAIRAVQVERTGTGWHIAKSVWAPTPSDTVRDGVVIDPVILGLAIKNMLKAGHIHATSAAIAISGGTVVVRPVRMPKMAESSLRKSIRFEASRYVPNSVEDSYIEFEITGDADSTNMDVIIAAAPKELVDSRIDACEQAGLEIEHVEVATFAAYRAMVEADTPEAWSEKTIGLVDIGASVTNLGVVSHGEFSMTRAIPAGGQVLTDALKSYFKLSDADAESGKAQLDIRGLMNEATVSENPPLRVLHTHVDDLVREVRRSINYWQSQQTEGTSARRVDAIILVGGGSNLPGLAEYFEHKLGISTVSKGLYENPRFIGNPSANERGTEIAVAVGLAMGLTPISAVKRNPKPAKLASETPAAGPKSPKPPKPTKPGKGKAPKIEASTEATSETIDSIETAPPVEIAAVAPAQEPTPAYETPAAYQPTPPVEVEEPTLEVTHVEELSGDPDEAKIIAEYGQELAALLHSAETPAVPQITPPVASLEELADAHVEPAAVPVAVESVEPVQVPSIDAERAAFDAAFDAPIDEPVVATKSARPSLFGRLAKGEKAPKPVREKAVKPQKEPKVKAVKPTKEAKIKPEKPAKVAKVKPPKLVKVQDDSGQSASDVKSKLTAAARWMFGSSQKAHVKPAGLLNAASKSAESESPQGAGIDSKPEFQQKPTAKAPVDDLYAPTNVALPTEAEASEKGETPKEEAA